MSQVPRKVRWQAGLVTRRFFSGTGIHVLNYTAEASFKGIWTDETRRCRGLVVGEEGEVLAGSERAEMFRREDESNA